MSTQALCDGCGKVRETEDRWLEVHVAWANGKAPLRAHLFWDLCSWPCLAVAADRRTENGGGKG